MENTVSNYGTRPKGPIEEVEHTDFSAIPTHARSPHGVGGYFKSHRNKLRGRASGPEHEAQGVILRLEDVPATPINVERIRERIRLLNRQLAASGTPLRLRMI